MSPAADSLGGNGSALTFNATETPRRFAILFWKPSKARDPQSSSVKTQNRLPVETLLDQRLHSHERRRQTLPEVLEIGSVTRRHLSPVFGVSTYGPEKGLRIMEGLGLVEVT